MHNLVLKLANQVSQSDGGGKRNRFDDLVYLEEKIMSNMRMAEHRKLHTLSSQQYKDQMQRQAGQRC